MRDEGHRLVPTTADDVEQGHLDMYIVQYTRLVQRRQQRQQSEALVPTYIGRYNLLGRQLDSTLVLSRQCPCLASSSNDNYVELSEPTDLDIVVGSEAATGGYIHSSLARHAQLGLVLPMLPPALEGYHLH
jgi:hypothetical protein